MRERFEFIHSSNNWDTVTATLSARWPIGEHHREKREVVSLLVQHDVPASGSRVTRKETGVTVMV